MNGDGASSSNWSSSIHKLTLETVLSCTNIQFNPEKKKRGGLTSGKTINWGAKEVLTGKSIEGFRVEVFDERSKHGW